MILALKDGGMEEIAFAGGDPTLRPDLKELISVAHAAKLRVEVQTNAHSASKRTYETLLDADLVGTSLDGASPNSHDNVRGRKGNFRRVFDLMGFLEAEHRPFMVRTVVSNATASNLEELGAHLSRYQHLIRWSLVQFIAIEDGFRNRSMHDIDEEIFQSVAFRCRDRYAGPAQVDVYSASAKKGVYFLIGSNGDAYREVSTGPSDHYRVAGNLLRTHARDLAQVLGVNAAAHAERYLNLIPCNERGAQEP